MLLFFYLIFLYKVFAQGDNCDKEGKAMNQQKYALYIGKVVMPYLKDDGGGTGTEQVKKS